MGTGAGRGASWPQRRYFKRLPNLQPLPWPPLMFPVAASKPGLAARAPSRKKKNKKGPVIRITEMSEKFLSQESEVSE